MALPLFSPPKDSNFYRKPAEEDLRWLLLDDSDWFNSTSFVTVGKDGSMLIFAAILANLKPMYTHQPGVHIKYADPSGKITHLSEKFDSKSLELTDNATSVAIKGFSFKRNAAENSYHVVFAEKGAAIRGELDFLSMGIDGVKFGDDGKIATNEERTEYCSLFFVLPRAQVTGKLTIGDKEVVIDGYGFVSHFRQNIKPHKYVLRWQLMKFHSLNVTLNQNLLVSPKTYGKQRVANGMFVYKGKLCAATLDNDIVYPTSTYDRDTGYDMPTSAEYTWKGKTLDGKDFSASLIEKMDILGHLPWAIRMIIKSFIARPYHYQWVDKCTAVISIGGETFEEAGMALHEVTFVNPE